MTLIAQKSLSQGNWLDKHAAANLLSISTYTLNVYRKKYWILGIHFQYLNSRTIRYHEQLLQDWLVNICDPQAHQRAIEVYQTSLLSNQNKKRGRRAR
ncbi:hypothetical protein [Myxosarcina sp. GI1]|uniref:hypothetical protein n=1 Tax=Myxosarcina sp. GI1 TaxID=1541065 RepID=UPI00069080EA|nr:hypothetical protein [Myxosarcina sp. GI1]